MELVHPSVVLWPYPETNQEVYQTCERAGRVSHLSEDRMGTDTWQPFLKKIALEKGDESILEHGYLATETSFASLVPKGRYVTNIIGYDDKTRNPTYKTIANIRAWRDLIRASKVQCEVVSLLCQSFAFLFEDVLTDVVREEMNRSQTPRTVRLLTPEEIPKLYQPRTFDAITDRGVTHEFVRHRKPGFTQESTRFVNYGKQGGCTFAIQSWVSTIEVLDQTGTPVAPARITDPSCLWLHAMQYAEQCYLRGLELGLKPQEARAMLPNSTKARIVITAQLIDWLWILTMRTSRETHPEFLRISLPMKEKLQKEYGNELAFLTTEQSTQREQLKQYYKENSPNV